MEVQIKVEQQTNGGLSGILASIEQGQGKDWLIKVQLGRFATIPRVCKQENVVWNSSPVC
jgi:hypothetical protein